MKKLSKKQERRIAEDVGGRTQPGSGCSPRAKGDVRKLGELRIEAKYTKARSYSLHLDDLRKILSECGEGEIATLVVDFLDPQSGRTTDSWAVVPYEDWIEKVRNASSDHQGSPRGRPRGKQ
jgi:hypothetical protein